MKRGLHISILVILWILILQNGFSVLDIFFWGEQSLLLALTLVVWCLIVLVTIFLGGFKHYFLPLLVFANLLITVYQYWPFYSNQKQVSETDFKVMTLNVSQFANDTANVNRILALIEVESPDLVCFQEFGLYYKWPNTGAVIENFARRAQMPHAHFKPADDDIFGVAILSKFPILNASLAFEDDVGTNQGYVYEVQMPERNLKVANVHLQSFNLNRGISFEALHKTLKKQKQQLQKTLMHSPEIILGDLNGVRGGTAAQMLKNDGFSDTEKDKGQGLLISHDKTKAGIDYIWVDSSITSVASTNIANVGSDHRVIISVLRL